jgi:alpha-L-fucosidase
MGRPLPSPRQLAYQDWEFGLFLHFGIRTFYEGYVDWDGKPMSAKRFDPVAFDPDQWIVTAKAAGMRYAVLTAKHHDGFANWPTRWTDFSVAAASWRCGEGDVVREFVEACRRHGVHPGLYYSPADWHYPYQSPQAYNDYLVGQLGELLTGYGEIDILWLDGCGSEEREYDWPRIMGEVRRLQPRILVFSMGDADFRWVGNEVGLAPMPCWNVVDGASPAAQAGDQDQGVSATLRWLPAECDCRLRYRNWFYSDRDEDTIKSLEELVGLYYYSVGRGCNLLLNVGPDRRGRLPEPDAERLRQLGRELWRRFADPIAVMEGLDDWIYRPDDPVLVDHVILQEDLRSGERIRRFAIETWPAPSSGMPIVVYEGRSVGHKAICRFPPVRASAVRLSVLEADGPVRLRCVKLYGPGEG